jgi:hypothetical protein
MLMRPAQYPFSDPGVAGTVTRRPGSAQTALPPWIRPHLTQLVDAAPEGDQWLHEINTTVAACMRGSTTAR